MPNPDATSTRTTRRNFLKSTTAVGAALGLPTAAAHADTTKTSPANEEQVKAPAAPAAEPEWRNRNPDMTYRMLGRTGFMVSEVVYGGYLMKPNTIDLYEAALDRGLNYLDQATAYGGGDGEKAIGALLKRGIQRDRFFLTTKLSHYNGYVRRMYTEKYKTLADGKQTEIDELAARLLEESGNTRPGYHVNYFKGQEGPFDGTYRVNAMKQLGYNAGSKKQFKDKMYEILEASMKRTTVDHYDVLFCPHSVESPEAFDDEALLEGMAELKKSGKARSLAFSAHNDAGANLTAAVGTGVYDVAMIGYNIVNHLALDPVIEQAAEAGMGVVAMKVARPVIVDALEWRIAKLNAMVPDEDLSIAQKAYLAALQNPNLSAVISDMADENMLNENLALAGRKTELNLV
ncbi:aldo/keto reductase [Algisphaera agarilytica]|uniref:Aryl-alcohol dehydrogenase-like predicted oxidoreductase n=1 Tax=Algisphaera agarilytica TaxID=1385975 RepID=A0A7X0LLN9_9BACT|nr:aldo/keto reductase [Algisphaera agarilytica]MBB6431700.1 aryl-alcohol dehydrogenase-like predicted oxidoreductase [Algisphaera agarilytica]